MNQQISLCIAVSPFLRGSTTPVRAKKMCCNCNTLFVYFVSNRTVLINDEQVILFSPPHFFSQIFLSSFVKQKYSKITATFFRSR